MEYNPHAAALTVLEHEITEAQSESNRRHADSLWHSSFDSEAALAALNDVRRESSFVTANLGDLVSKVDALSSSVARAKEGARLGWDPRYWFSAERSAKSREANELKIALVKLTNERDDLKKRIDELGSRIIRQQAELERYRGFSAKENQEAICSLAARLHPLLSERVRLRPLKQQIDDQLREPLAELNSLLQRQSTLQGEIRDAQRLENELSNASDGRERWSIHQRCEDTFGEGKPGRVLSDRKRELESVARGIGKLDKRLRSIGQNASRTIKTLVLDGNNLCYQDGTFIRLGVLKALARELASRFEVEIVFDSNIRGQLKMRDDDIRSQFGNGVTVHVVASKQKADETILDSAPEPTAYVISNDRFADFPEKPAVRDKRLIRHEILNGKVFIHDLNVAASFAT
jgi:hypothetical protein